MPYLIDGHNLIGKLPGIALDDLDDEQALIETLQEFCQDSAKDAEVYFDHSASGHARARVHGRVTARYVRSGETADQAIARHLQRLENEAANWTVVSSDREVLAAAKRARARILSSEDFARQLAGETEDTSPGEVTLSSDEVDEWMQMFGGEEET